MSGTDHTQAFDAASSDFDRLGQHLWRPIGLATVERTAPGDGERVLDACCGNGASAIPAARRVGPAGQVDAVDLSAALVGELAASTATHPQLHTHTADVTSWPHTGYDVVQSVLGVFFFPDMAAGTEHLVRRARPGGRVGVTIWRRGSMEVAGSHLRAAVAHVTGAEARARPTGPIDAITEAGAFRTWLTARGLDTVDVTTHELHLALTPELAWLVVTGSGYIAALAGLTTAQVDAVRETYLGSLSRAGVDTFDATTLIGTGTVSSRR